jgi:hypothetical protein
VEVFDKLFPKVLMRLLPLFIATTTRLDYLLVKLGNVGDGWTPTNTGIEVNEIKSSVSP